MNNRRSFLAKLGLVATSAPLLERACSQCSYGNPIAANFCCSCGCKMSVIDIPDNNLLLEVNKPVKLNLGFHPYHVNTEAILTSCRVDVSRDLIPLSRDKYIPGPNRGIIDMTFETMGEILFVEG